MAKDSDDNYKEGVDFEWVQGNDDENSGFKTRRFFTRAEKKARSSAPTTSPMPKARPKAGAKLKGITTPKVTTKKIDQAVRPEGMPAGMPQNRAIKNYTEQLASGKLSASEARSARTALTGLQSGLDKLKADRSKKSSGYKSGGLVTKSGSTRPCKMC